MSEKPLHVQVAEALGYEPCGFWKVWGQGLGGTEWISDGCSHRLCYPEQQGPPRFDTNWSATGPLIEKYKIGLSHSLPDETWSADWNDWKNEIFGVSARLPLLAVCYLILELRSAGKLAA